MKRTTQGRARTPSAPPEIRALLHAGDPWREGGELPPDEVARMRRAVVAEARMESRFAATRWRLAPVAAAAGLLAAIFVGYALRVDPESPPPGAGADAVPAATPARGDRGHVREQQVQFVTANGTRVIWVLSSDLDL